MWDLIRKDIESEIEECCDFEDFFVTISKHKMTLDKNNLKKLRDFVLEFVDVYNVKSIVYLADTISAEIYLPCNATFDEETNTEKEFKNKIIANFNNLFPDFEYVGTEINVDTIGRIDILAKNKSDNRDVIIELKMRNHNPNKQLKAYPIKYDNPILVGITELELSDKIKRNDIIYYTFSDLLNKHKETKII